MDYLPLFARLADQPCLVVGGGTVAARKARALHRAGARVTLRAPEFSDELTAFAGKDRVELEVGPFVPNDLRAFVLVVAATDDPTVNTEVAALANSHKTLCNVVDDGNASSVIMPAIVDRSPVLIAISTGGHSPVLARRLKNRLEALLPARLGDLARLLGRYREAVRKRFPNIDRRRRFWERLLDTKTLLSVAEGAIDDQQATAVIDKTIETSSTSSTGIAYLVGAGPGDPDLLTVKAQRLLADADVVLYDRLVDAAILDRARRDAQLINVGKAPGGEATPQSRINELLITHVRAGQSVVRLKGGDPFIFGRGGEELAALQGAGLSVQVIPGITAAQGCAASIGLPLTLRGGAQGLTLVTAHGAGDANPDLDWDALCANAHTLVFYMAVANLPFVRRGLLRGLPPSTPVTVVEQGTTPRERVHRTVLAKLDRQIGGHEVRAPALVFVGKNAGQTAAKVEVA